MTLVPSGGMLTPPENNSYDPQRFGERLPSPEEKFERRTTMRGSMWDNAPRGYNQRHRAQNILRKTNKSNQRRGQEVCITAHLIGWEGNVGKETPNKLTFRSRLLFSAVDANRDNQY